MSSKARDHMSSSILTEGRVSAKILSFADKTFLFTGTVCKSWHQNSKSTETGADESVESVKRLKEAREAGLNVYLASFCCLRNGADISIIRKLHHPTCFWEQEDIEHAAQKGRIDVLQLMHDKGCVADERVLHTAVRYNQRRVVEYLLSVGCPVDAEVIDELKMRSMEVAISEENLPMVKILRTVDYPFVADSFRFACDTENKEILNYIVQEGCQAPDYLFPQSVEGRDFFTLEFLIDNGMLKEEWDLWGCVMDADVEMMSFLLRKGIKPTDDDVDSAIAAGNLEIAQFLTNEHSCCRPTHLAYTLKFENSFCDCHYLMYLRWLYDDMRCSLGFSSLEEMRDDPRGAYVLDRCSGTIEDSFEERLG